MKKIYIYLSCFLLSVASYGQISNPILIEAEDADYIGDDWDVIELDDTTYVTALTDRDMTGDFPALEDKVLSFEIPDVQPGTYHLYVKLRVGPDGPNDDSFWFPASFGELDPTDATNWVVINNISNGAANPDSIVSTAATGLGSNVFKWINASLLAGGDDPSEHAFIVEEAGEQTLQIGSRENGLDFDKIALADANFTYTVYDLEHPTETVGINSSHLNSNAIKLYPNPVNDVLTVTLNIKPGANASLEIYSLTGNLIRSIDVSSQNLSINVKDLASGMYLMKSYFNGKYDLQKFIVK